MTDHALIGEAAKIPTSAPTPFLSVTPIVVPSTGRPVDLHIRVSAPTTGHDLPVILLSHGHGQSNNLSSLNGYGPLASFWAAHGFVVIQPTHLSSKSLSLNASTPGAPLFWRSRAQDMTTIIDHLEHIEASAPQLKGRLDHSRIAVAGHSLGGHTASLLLGMRLRDPEQAGSTVDLADTRIRAGVLLAAPGSGGADLSAFAYDHYPVFRESDFTTMATPALVVVGDADESPHLTVRGPDWHADPYTRSPGPKSLLSLAGGKHGLGGIAGYDAAETNDESPERVAVVQRLTWAYLRSALYPDDKAWSVACSALKGLSALGTVESK